MKKFICTMLVFAIIMTVAAMAESVRVGISWVGDFEGEPDEDTRAYIDAVTKAGGEPVYLPQITDEESAKAALKTVECVILTGGEDLDPALYGETPAETLETVNNIRDTSDMLLAKAALDADMPILATCRGMQLINVVFGGTLYQDIPTEYESEISHRDPEEEDFAYHTITIENEESLAAQAMGGAGSYEVNSWHHQGVKTVGEGLIVTAVAEDGMVEALEMENPDQYLLAVQFHPEWHVDDGNEEFLAFFKILMDCAEENRAAA